MYKIFLMLSFGVIYANNFQVEPRIINGSQVSDEDLTWKFIVTLKYNNNFYCSGSLVSPSWILTSAHCLFDISNNKAFTVSPLDTIGTDSYIVTNTTNFAIEKFILHPSFNINTLNNDIALIKLRNPIFTIQPIPYDKSYSLNINAPTKVAGWGSVNTTNDDYPSRLHEALTPILDFNQCNASLSYNGTLTNNMICAGYWEGTRDSCRGDSGGPLVLNKTLVGIISWGYGCARNEYPGIYTKVKNYINWINSYLPKDVNRQWVPIVTDNINIFIPSSR